MSTLGNRAKETSSTQGTGTYDLDGPVAGFQSIAAAAAKISGDGVGPWDVPLHITDGVDFEDGLYTVTSGSPDTAARTSIEDSSNGGAAVNWGSGTRNVMLNVTAGQLADLLDNSKGNGLLERTATDTYTVAPVTAAGKALLDDPSADAQLTTLGASALGKLLFAAASVAAARGDLDLTFGVLASRPAASTANAVYVATDTLQIFLDTGSAWKELAADYASENALINPAGLIAQRANYTLVKDTWGFGGCDRWEGMATGTAVSAGTLEQATSSPIGRAGTAVYFNGVTLTGTGILYLRQRIESGNAKIFIDQPATFRALVQHDVGSGITYTITVRKANAVDNFSATTEIDNDGGTSVASATETLLEFEISDMGSCGNGIEVEIKIECGAVTTKTFLLTEMQAVPRSADVVGDFVYPSVGDDLARCRRYFRKTFPYGTAPAQSAGLAGALGAYSDTSARVVFDWHWGETMRAAPTIVTYNPSAADAKAENVTSTPDADIDGNQSLGDSGVAMYADTIDTNARWAVHATAEAEL